MAIDYEMNPAGFVESLTWAQVYRRARAVAEQLLLNGSSGDRAAILARQGWTTSPRSSARCTRASSRCRCRYRSSVCTTNETPRHRATPLPWLFSRHPRWSTRSPLCDYGRGPRRAAHPRDRRAGPRFADRDRTGSAHAQLAGLSQAGLSAVHVWVDAATRRRDGLPAAIVGSPAMRRLLDAPVSKTSRALSRRSNQNVTANKYTHIS
jgi:hypothetical protein